MFGRSLLDLVLFQISHPSPCLISFMQHVKSVRHVLLCCPAFFAYPSVCLICFRRQARGVRHGLFVAPPLMVPIALFCSRHLCICMFGCYHLLDNAPVLFLPFPFGWLFFSIRFAKVSSRSHFIETLKWNPLLPCGFCEQSIGGPK